MVLTVVVTGASGKTGALVVAELLKQPDRFAVRAVVRSATAQALMLSLGVTEVVLADLSAATGSSSLSAGAAAALRLALQGADALVICTSAVPEPKLLPTLLGGLRHALRGLLQRRQQAAAAAAPFVPVATWKGGQTPAQVDWLGQKLQIDAAKAAGVRHVVLISSAGGCDPRHFLNHIGQGDILNHKRRAEQHLIASGLTYSILHPNHLNDDAADGYQLLLGVDDELQAGHWRSRPKMPRALLAWLAVQMLLLVDQGAADRSIDCAGRRVRDAAAATTATEDVRLALAAMPRDCVYTINDRTLSDAPFCYTAAATQQA